MHTRIGVLGLVGVALGWGCSGPSLDLPEREGATTRVDFEPAAGEGSVAPLFRARLRDAPAGQIPWLFRGELSEYYARSVRQGQVPSALRERAVALRFWRDGSDCWLQPSVWLEPDTSYTLALSGRGVVSVVQAVAGGEPIARRLFPLPGSEQRRAAVFCDLGPDRLPSSLTLEPGSVAVQVTPGVAGQAGEGCVTLRVEGELQQAAVAPPLLAGALFQPSPWLPSPAGSYQPEVTSCSSGEPFHGACLEVEDDRLRVTPSEQDLLFALAQPQRLILPARAGSRGLLVRGLLPASTVTLAGTVLSSEGELTTFGVTVTTAMARRHLVVNEVLANPLGPEPEAEWLELVNDSERATSLAGVWLEDSAGTVQLPDEVLAPGELVLVVSQGFRASGLDVPVPENVRLLRVPSLGARGLSNGGEALMLVGREGVLSRFPLLTAAHAGRSLARRTLDGADDDAAGFGEHAGPGASPGAPNVLDE